MATTYKFSISSEKKDEQTVKLEVSGFTKKISVLGKIRIGEVNYSIKKNKIQTVSINLFSLNPKTDVDYVKLCSENKQTMINLANDVVNNAVKSFNLVKLLNFDLSVLMLPDQLSDIHTNKLQIETKLIESEKIQVIMNLKPLKLK